MVLVSLLDRQRTRDRARPRPNAPGNYITDQSRATVFSLTFTPSPENYIKWWPYSFPETKAIGYIDNPEISPQWVAVGPLVPAQQILNIADSIIPGGTGAGVPPIEVPDFGVPLPPEGSPGGVDPIDIAVPVVPPVSPVNVNVDAQLTVQTANTAGRTFTSMVGTSPVFFQPSRFPIRGVTVLNDPDNGGDIFIGYDSQVTVSNGFRLVPGAGKFLNIDNLADLFLVATAVDTVVHVEYTK